MFYVNLMVITKHKDREETQNIKKGRLSKSPRETTNLKVERNKRKKKQRQNNQKAKDKMAVVHPYISIISLSVNGLNSPIMRHRLYGLKKKTQLYTAYSRLISALKTLIALR